MDSHLHHTSTQEAPSHLHDVATPPPADDLDDLFNYDARVDDVFRQVDTDMNVPSNEGSRPGNRGTETGAGLGIDEEIKISRKRRPAVKLDVERLLSQGGIPKLRRISKERLRFKGRGHEYKDITRILNLYQLWLDDLFPRAKFADALTIIEKLGHTRRMQTMRREWIDEGKPRSSFREDTRHTPSIVTENKPSQSAQSNSEQKEQRSESGTFADTSTPRLQQRPHTPPGEIRQADDDLYNVTPGAVRKTVVQGHGSNDDGLFVAASSPGAQPEEDELDILLAEETHAGQGSGNQSLSIESPAADNFDDEMEAMADMDNMW